jgi:hypothetical protein
MPRKSPPFHVQEHPGDHYASLEDAQREALPFLASHVAETIRDLLASGQLAQVNGRIIPNSNR